jgi:hypothetical protein
MTELADKGRAAIGALVDEWLTALGNLRALEETEHPDLIDVLGRAWKWKAGDIYTHDGMAWPETFITSPSMGLPGPVALENPNYQWCAICKPAAS